MPTALTDPPPRQPEPTQLGRDRRTPLQGRIVWVDDDPNITAAAHRRLRKRRIQMWSAADGMHGYWLAVTRKPDVIITDLRMPRWQGRDLLECLLTNKVTCTVPVIVLSGYVTPEDRTRLLRLGVIAVFEKPAPWSELLRVVRPLLKPD